MNLKSWIESQKNPYGIKAFLARETGISKPIIYALARGRPCLTPSIAVKISQVTEGEVTVEELLFPDGIPTGAKLSAT